MQEMVEGRGLLLVLLLPVQAAAAAAAAAGVQVLLVPPWPHHPAHACRSSPARLPCEAPPASLSLTHRLPHRTAPAPLQMLSERLIPFVALDVSASRVQVGGWVGCCVLL